MLPKDRVRSRVLVCTVLAAFVLLPILGVCAQAVPDLVLRGSITHEDNQTYKVVPFTVPAGVTRVTVDFTYTAHEQKTVIDVGLMGPDGFRGWSGGRPGAFTVSTTDASPSYLPGRIVPGTWNLLLGIPNIRANVTTSYEAKVYFSRSENAVEAAGGVYPVIETSQRWYRGDLHMHTGHSDGTCTSQSGKRVPCPEFITVDSASRRKLDFIAITDHNTISQYEEMRELQPYFDRILLIPGRELTTFQGHANVFSTTAFLDFRVGSAAVPTWNDLLRQARAAGGLVSINHPNDPTGEACMGCGWNPSPIADLQLVTAVEAINGIDAESSHSGIPFWQERLNRGYRLTAIGGSDNHNASAPLPGPGSIGYPTTVVFARELSIGGILDAIRAGHVFIDVTGSPDRLLEMSVRSGSETANMGDELQLPAGRSAEFALHVTHCSGHYVEVIVDGTVAPVLPENRIGSDDQSFTFAWQSDGNRHWVRTSVRDAQKRLMLVGNPIYINFIKTDSAGEVKK